MKRDIFVLLVVQVQLFVQLGTLAQLDQLRVLFVQLETTVFKGHLLHNLVLQVFTVFLGNNNVLNVLLGMNVCMLINLQSNVMPDIIALLDQLIAHYVQQAVSA